MANKRDRTKAAIVKRLSEVRIVEIACKSVGISRATYYRWLKEDPQFEAACNEAIRQGTATICDLAESQIVAKIRSGDFRASTYFLEKHHNDYKPQTRQGRSKPDVSSYPRKGEFTDEDLQIVMNTWQRMIEDDYVKKMKEQKSAKHSPKNHKD